MTTTISKKTGQIMGPVDYIVVSFPGNKFSGEIVPELARLEQNKTIRIIDLAFVLKDQKGNVLITEAKNLGGVVGDAFSAFAEKASEWFSIDDIEAIATVLPNNSSAGIILYENTWAIHLKEGLLNSKAELIDMGRIPSEIIRSVEQKLIAKGSV
ncbi:MAG: DUF6325 family protein [Methanomicrobiales archaeon]